MRECFICGDHFYNRQLKQHQKDCYEIRRATLSGAEQPQLPTAHEPESSQILNAASTAGAPQDQAFTDVVQTQQNQFQEEVIFDDYYMDDDYYSEAGNPYGAIESELEAAYRLTDDRTDFDAQSNDDYNDEVNSSTTISELDDESYGSEDSGGISQYEAEDDQRDSHENTDMDDNPSHILTSREISDQSKHFRIMEQENPPPISADISMELYNIVKSKNVSRDAHRTLVSFFNDYLTSNDAGKYILIRYH